MGSTEASPLQALVSDALTSHADKLEILCETLKLVDIMSTGDYSDDQHGDTIAEIVVHYGWPNMSEDERYDATLDVCEAICEIATAQLSNSKKTVDDSYDIDPLVVAANYAAGCDGCKEGDERWADVEKKAVDMIIYAVSVPTDPMAKVKILMGLITDDPYSYRLESEPALAALKIISTTVREAGGVEKMPKEQFPLLLKIGEIASVIDTAYERVLTEACIGAIILIPPALERLKVSPIFVDPQLAEPKSRTRDNLGKLSIEKLHLLTESLNSQLSLALDTAGIR